MYRKCIALLVITFTLALSGCMPSTITPAPTPVPEVTALPSSTSAPAASNVPVQGVNKARLPKQLDELEDAAEDIFEDVDKDDWAKAQTHIDEMNKYLADLEPTLQSTGVQASLANGIRTSLTELQQQVNNKNAFEAKVQANAITKVIPDILDYYQVTKPTDLYRLEYLGREAALNAEKGDWTAANNNISEVQNVWARLKPNLDSTVQKNAADFETTINALNDDVAKKDASATFRSSKDFLDKVDDLEDLYD